MPPNSSKKQSFYAVRELPYRTQIVPLAAVLTQLQERWLEPRIYDKLAQWFWCGILGELYGGAVETRIANDLEELLLWINDDTHIPRTVGDASFQPERLDRLTTRLSAAYKGINVLVLREGAADFFWKASIKELDAQEIALDIHHIFPRAWCEEKGIPKKTVRYDCQQNSYLLQSQSHDWWISALRLSSKASKSCSSPTDWRRDGQNSGESLYTPRETAHR